MAVWTIAVGVMVRILCLIMSLFPVAPTSNRVNLGGTVVNQGIDVWPEYAFKEFVAATTGATVINNHFSDKQPTGREGPDNPYISALVSLSLNPAIRNRIIYTYLWANPINAASGHVTGQLVFKYGANVVLRLPLTYIAPTVPIPGTAPPLSLFTLGTNVNDTIQGFLWQPAGAGGIDPEPNNVSLRSFVANFAADSVQFDLIDWANCEVSTTGNSHFRMILGAKGF